MTATATAPATDDIIEVQGLRKRYAPDAPEAVQGIDFAVRRGEVFGLLGPNGAGKTTTIGVITTRVIASEGSVRVDGIDVTKDPVAARMRIAVVPQLPNLDRTLNAIENLTFHAAYFGVGRRERLARARELMVALGLEGRERDQVNDYSGGMAQRLMIARALMHEPQVLVLDEPTTGLDPQSRLFLWDKIVELQAKGTTIMLTTHDMVEADRLCQRIAIVDHGKVIALDTPPGLRSLLPADRGLDVSVTADSDPRDAFAQLQAAERLGDSYENDGRWHVRIYGDADALPAQAFEAAQQADLTISELRRIEGTLEDVFVHLTGRELR